MHRRSQKTGEHIQLPVGAGCELDSIYSCLWQRASDCRPQRVQALSLRAGDCRKQRVHLPFSSSHCHTARLIQHASRCGLQEHTGLLCSSDHCATWPTGLDCSRRASQAFGEAVGSRQQQGTQHRMHDSQCSWLAGGTPFCSSRFELPWTLCICPAAYMAVTPTAHSMRHARPLLLLCCCLALQVCSCEL
jgi:hypothetical protein